MSIKDYIFSLLESIERVATADQWQWLNDALAAVDGDRKRASYFVAIARARRRLGGMPLGRVAPPLQTPLGELPVASWAVGNAARVALLLKAVQAYPREAAGIINEAYRLGGESEKRALVAGLALYADDDRYKALALQCGRANSLRLFRAVAVNNPYPAACYQRDEFNQLVLKALFMGVDCAAIIGLEDRANEDLSRMCVDYHDELMAAGRPVPADIWLAIVPHADSRGLELGRAALHAPDREHRYYAALAVARHGIRALGPVVETRCGQERDPRIYRLLMSAMTRERNKAI